MIFFEGGFLLHINCDGIECYDPGDDDFIVYTPNGSYSLTNLGEVK